MNTINNAVLTPKVDTANRYGVGIKVGNFRLPNFTTNIGMPTKTEPSMSDEEIKEAIAKIAREDAEKGHFQKQTEAFLDLKREYISSVSPDREGIITSSAKQIDNIKQTLKQMLTKTDSPEQAKTLLQLIMDKEKSKDKTTISLYSLEKTDTFGKLNIENDKITHVEFYSDKGEMIGSYSNNGWSCFFTKDETARQIEFFSTYNEAWRNANNEINPSTPKHLEGGTAIDAYA